MKTQLLSIDYQGLDMNHAMSEGEEVETRLSFYSPDLPKGSIHLQYSVDISADELKEKLMSLANLIPNKEATNER